MRTAFALLLALFSIASLAEAKQLKALPTLTHAEVCDSMVTVMQESGHGPDRVSRAVDIYVSKFGKPFKSSSNGVTTVLIYETVTKYGGRKASFTAVEITPTEFDGYPELASVNVRCSGNE